MSLWEDIEDEYILELEGSRQISSQRRGPPIAFPQVLPAKAIQSKVAKVLKVLEMQRLSISAFLIACISNVDSEGTEVNLKVGKYTTAKSRQAWMRQNINHPLSAS
jgi:hypothetical protein